MSVTGSGAFPGGSFAPFVPPPPARSAPPRAPRGAVMLAHVRSAALWGLEAFPVECEVDVGPGQTVEGVAVEVR